MNAPQHVEWHHRPVLHLCFRNICCSQAASTILIHMYTYSIQAWSLFEISSSESSPSISWWIVSSLCNLHFERQIRRRGWCCEGQAWLLELSVSHFIMNNTAKARLIFPKQQLQIFHNELHLHMVTICATVYVNHPLEARHSSSAPSELHWGIIWSKHPCIVLKISAELRYRIYSLLSAFMKRLVHLHLAPIDQKEENSVRNVVALHHSMMKSNSQPFCKIRYTLNFTVQRMWFAVNIEPF